MSFRDIDFRPVAEPGWRALYVYEDGGHDVLPLAGWLVQEEWDDDREAPVDAKPADRWRRIVAAIAGGDSPGGPEAVDQDEDLMDYRAFARLLAPGEPVPDVAAIHAEHAKYRDDRIGHRRALAAKDAPKVLAALARSTPQLGDSLAGLSAGRTGAALSLLAEQGQAAYDRDAGRWRAVAPPQASS